MYDFAFIRGQFLASKKERGENYKLSVLAKEATAMPPEEKCFSQWPHGRICANDGDKL